MNNTELIKKGLAKRYAREARFQLFGKLAVMTGFAFLIILLFDIGSKAIPAFYLNFIKLDINFTADNLHVDDDADVSALESVDYRKLTRNTLYEIFPEVKKRKEKKALGKMLSNDAEYQVKDIFLSNREYFGQSRAVWVMLDDDIDSYLKSGTETARITASQISWLDTLKKNGQIRTQFNWRFFSGGDSREPEIAGILGAAMGSIFTVAVCLLVSFPVGVLAAVYLEEFAPKNRWVDVIEININNLAAVPSIVFGLLGLAVFINFFGMPRSAPLVGGLVLALMTLPTIIISSRSAIKAVPPSIREAALGVGASRMQMVFQHVIPLAMPGILTGTIIGTAQALGETAPLLMIGMVAFIVDIPQGFTDSATVLPIQIYLWADSPERTFVAKTSAAIIVLLVFLICMNALAVFLRKKFEKNW